MILPPEETFGEVSIYDLPLGFLIVVKFAAEVDPAAAPAHFPLRRTVPDGKQQKTKHPQMSMSQQQILNVRL